MATTPAVGTDASPTVTGGTPALGGTPDAGGGSATGVTLDDVQTFVAGTATGVDPEDLTAVDFVDGEMTVDTTWDDTAQADAEALCDELMTMTTDPPVSSVTINDTEGNSLAECGEGMG